MRSLKPFAAAALCLVFAVSALPSFGRNDDKVRSVQNLFSVTQNNIIATVTISGKVQTPEGRPIKDARIVLKDADSNQVVGATFSSSFGFYRLQQIETGHSYVLSVSHRRYLFALPAQLLEINEDRPGMNFIGEADVD
jgi:hypothetical protein